MLDVFYREFRNLPIATANASFQQKYFKYFDESDVAEKKLENVVIVDPAKTVNMNSADSAVVGIGIDTLGNSLYIRDVDARKMHPDELYDAAINMCVRLNARVLAVEVTSLNEFITQPFKNELSRRGLHYIEFVELKARGGTRAESKEQRVRALVPYYRQGLVYHKRQACHGLESQIMAFPRAKRWDIMDATAYVIELLDVGERYFEPPADADDYDFDNDPVLADLDNDAPLENWRCA